MFPQNNLWAAIGGAATTVVVFVLQALVAFFGTGQAWPSTTEGWFQIIVPALAAGLLAALTPAASAHEARTGYRRVQSGRDAPVVVLPKDLPTHG